VENLSSPKQVLVCQYHTCRKDGAARVLEAFQANPVAGVTVSGCGCLGLCGSGPIVLITPDNTYYWHIRPKNVPTLIDQHLRHGQVVVDLLHARLHPDPNEFL